MKIIVQKPCVGKPFFLGYFVGSTVEVDDELAKDMISAGVASQFIPEGQKTKGNEDSDGNKGPEMKSIKVTAKFLKNNPSLKDQGIQVGDTIEIPVE